MKNLILKFVLCGSIMFGILSSCSEDEYNYNEPLTEIPNEFKKIMIEATELKGNVYIFNEDEAKLKGLPITYIEKMKYDINNVNLSLNNLRLEDNHEIELVDPSTLDVDKLIKEYDEQTFPRNNITGDLSTTNSSPKIKSFWNPNKTQCKFTYMQRVAMTATHTVGTRGFGDWKYKTRVAFLIGSTYSSILPFDVSNYNCNVYYRTGDGRGGFCGYTAY